MFAGGLAASIIYFSKYELSVILGSTTNSVKRIELFKTCWFRRSPVRKLFYLKKNAVVISLIFLLAGCGWNSISTRPPEAGSQAESLILKRLMPAAAADGLVKTAIVRNQTVTDHSRQFIEGCVFEGRALGFTVDTFVSGGDEKRCLELLAKIAGADYDGLILSNGDAAFTWKALGPAAAKGIKIVTFDALPYINGDPAMGIMPGLTSTAQDDEKLARLSLEAIVSAFEGKQPVRVIRVWSSPPIPPLERRKPVYDAFVREGKIEEAAFIEPADFAYSRSGIREALSAILPDFPPGSVDAIWAPYDEFAKGCADALIDAGRTDIKLVSIDISNDDIRMMTENSGIWLGTAALDPALAGTVTMRILAAKLAAEDTPAEYSFDVQFVETRLLSGSTNMENIGLLVPDWGKSAGLFDSYPWMIRLKAAKPESSLPALEKGEAPR